MAGSTIISINTKADPAYASVPASSAGTEGDEVELTTTNPTQIVTTTPSAAGTHFIGVYFRVVAGAPNVKITLTWTDAGGAQSVDLTNQIYGIGSFSLLYFIAATATAITVTATADVANEVFVSAEIF